MSNLGLYQDITTRAKAAGGVEPWLRGLRARHMAIGAVVGLVVGVGATYAAAEVDRRLQQRKVYKAPPRAYEKIAVEDEPGTGSFDSPEQH